MATTVTLATLRAFEDHIRKDLPDFRVAFKDESWLMKCFGILASPFNSRFMTGYTTTLGNTVYFPDRAFYQKHPVSRLQTLAHEYVHLWDAKHHPKTFHLGYVFPQILAVVPALLFLVLAWPHSWLLLLPVASYALGAWLSKWWQPLFYIVSGLLMAGTLALTWWLAGWSLLAFIGMLACLAPWPAPWRTKWELRGYGMSVAMTWWLHGTDAYREGIIGQFTGPSYYFMSWSRGPIEEDLAETTRKIKANALQGLPPFKSVYEFLYQRDLLRHG